MADYQRDIRDLVEAVKNAKRRGKKVALLIGAGCSVTAGIPTAAGFVNIIKERWPVAYERATPKDYPHCMAELSDGERRDLIAEKVEQAKVNWAHLAIAQLIKNDIVDRVLTTNFDPLVLRACAHVAVFPGVYDFAASQRFKPAYTSQKAIFHLHGQHTGFVLLHDPGEVDRLSEAIAPLFEDAGRGRLWLVVGYSGESDPVFKHLAQVKRFDERLYWVGYKENPPATHVANDLLGSDKSAYFVTGYDADDFFAVLGQELKVFPPAFVEKPFTHSLQQLETLTSYCLPNETSQIDVCGATRALLQGAIRDIEEGIQGKTLLAQHFLLAGEYDRVIELQSDDMPPSLVENVAWAFILQANQLSAQAETKSGEDADKLFAQSGEKYAAALKIKPDSHEALNNWGATLFDQAKTKSGDDADKLFAQAGETLSICESLMPGAAAYNLACICSLQNDPQTCRQWLETARTCGTLPLPAHLASDSDLDNVRGQEWFSGFTTDTDR